jgi:hypothetical protein
VCACSCCTTAQCLVCVCLVVRAHYVLLFTGVFVSYYASFVVVACVLVLLCLCTMCVCARPIVCALGVCCMPAYAVCIMWWIACPVFLGLCRENVCAVCRVCGPDVSGCAMCTPPLSLCMCMPYSLNWDVLGLFACVLVSFLVLPPYLKVHLSVYVFGVVVCPVGVLLREGRYSPRVDR